MNLKNIDLLIFSGDHFVSDEIISKNNIAFESNSYLTLLECYCKDLGVLSFPLEIMSILRQEDPKKHASLQRILPDVVSEQDHICLSYKRFSDKHLIILSFYEILKKKFNSIYGERDERSISLHTE